MIIIFGILSTFKALSVALYILMVFIAVCTVHPRRVRSPRYPNAPLTLALGSPVLYPIAYTILPAIQTQPAAAATLGWEKPAVVNRNMKVGMFSRVFW